MVMASASPQLAMMVTSRVNPLTGAPPLNKATKQVVSGDPNHSTTLGSAALEEVMWASNQPITGDKGNPYYSSALGPLEQLIKASNQPVTGDRGNPYHRASLGLTEPHTQASSQEPMMMQAAASTLTAAQPSGKATKPPVAGDKAHQPSAGDRENSYHPATVGSLTVEELMKASNQPFTGDRGNPYHSAALGPLEQLIKAANQPVAGDKGNPYHAAALNSAGPHTQTLTQESMVVSSSASTLTAAAPPVKATKQPAAGEKRKPQNPGVIEGSVDQLTRGSNRPIAGIPYPSATLGSAALEEWMKASSQPFTGNRGNPYHSTALGPLEQLINASNQPVAGDKGNPYHTDALNASQLQSQASKPLPIMTKSAATPQTAAQASLKATKQPVTGEGNPHHSAALASKEQQLRASSQPITGDKGNPYHSAALGSVALEQLTRTSNQPITGDRGNPYHSAALGQLEQLIKASHQPVTGDRGNPIHSAALGPMERPQKALEQPVTDPGKPYSP